MTVIQKRKFVGICLALELNESRLQSRIVETITNLKHADSRLCSVQMWRTEQTHDFSTVISAITNYFYSVSHSHESVWMIVRGGAGSLLEPHRQVRWTDAWTIVHEECLER